MLVCFPQLARFSCEVEQVVVHRASHVSKATPSRDPQRPVKKNSRCWDVSATQIEHA
jgi:hypothetical protein